MLWRARPIAIRHQVACLSSGRVDLGPAQVHQAVNVGGDGRASRPTGESGDSAIGCTQERTERGEKAGLRGEREEGEKVDWRIHLGALLI